MVRVGLASAWLLLSAGLPAAPSDPWLRITSANFELFTTANERAGRESIEQFERVRSFFQQAFGLIPGEGKPVQVVAFRSAREFEPYKLNEAAIAYFQPALDRDFIVMQAASADHGAAAVHEYTHLLIRQMGRIPQWLNEGLAELYSNLEARGGEVLVGQVIPGRSYTLERERWMDLRELLAVNERSAAYNEKTHAGVFYAESWFLVHMLALQEYYAPRFRQFGAALQEGGAEAAFLKAQVEQDLHLYFQSPHLTGRLFRVQLAGPAEAPRVERGGFAARVALAALLNALPGRREAARAACEGLDRDYPGHWETEQRWAELFWRDRNLQEAARHFAVAVAARPENSRLYLEYGRVLAASGRRPEALAALQTAAKLDGISGEVRLELGVMLVQDGAFREGLAELQRIRKLDAATAIRYFYNVAYARYRMGDPAGAKEALEQAGPFVNTERDREAMEGLRAACCSR